MDTITFDRLLLKTAFCCMASDGSIDQSEIEAIKSMCEESPLFENFNFEKEINLLVDKINKDGKEYIRYYFGLVKDYNLTEEQELILINFAFKTITADGKIEYSELKFFKVIRHSLNISDEKILFSFPELEEYLEKDIITETFLEKVTDQYLDIAELPRFDIIKIPHINSG